MRRILCVCLFAIFVFVTSAQQPQQTQTQAQPNPPVPQAPAVQAPGAIKVSTEVVIEEVNVKDKSGNPIEGLTAKDFVLTEDGVPQTISFVEYQRLPPVGAPPAPPSTRPAVTTMFLSFCCAPGSLKKRARSNFTVITGTTEKAGSFAKRAGSRVSAIK